VPDHGLCRRAAVRAWILQGGARRADDRPLRRARHVGRHRHHHRACPATRCAGRLPGQFAGGQHPGPAGPARRHEPQCCRTRRAHHCTAGAVEARAYRSAEGCTRSAGCRGHRYPGVHRAEFRGRPRRPARVVRADPSHPARRMGRLRDRRRHRGTDRQRRIPAVCSRYRQIAYRDAFQSRQGTVGPGRRQFRVGRLGGAGSRVSSYAPRPTSTPTPPRAGRRFFTASGSC
jgi:hypothetical protein